MSLVQADVDLLEFEAGVNEAPVSLCRGAVGLAAEALVIRPEVVRLLVAGVSEKEICASLNVSKQVLRRCMREADFSALLEIEIRRVMRHMMKRDLKAEKYLQLTTSVAMMIDKMRLLRDEPTSIQRGSTLTIIENLTVGLHGRGRAASERISTITQDYESIPVLNLPPGPDEGTEDESGSDDLVDGLDRQFPQP